MLIQNIISFEQFKEYTDKYKYIIVNISASWCKPCIAIKPHIEKFISVIDEMDYIYLKIDNSIFDEDIEFENFFHLDKIPYFAFIKNGTIIDNFVSGDFNTVSKRLFDKITNERNEDRKQYNNFNINEDF
jgi:thiol-disulfide isomerase/thioredoxin